MKNAGIGCGESRRTFFILHSPFLLPKWRNAVDLHHLPIGTHSLAPRPGSLGWLTFHVNRSRPTRFRSICEDEGEDEGEDEDRNWSAWQGSHLQPFRFERNASSLGYTRVPRGRQSVLPVGIALTLNGV